MGLRVVNSVVKGDFSSFEVPLYDQKTYSARFGEHPSQDNWMNYSVNQHKFEFRRILYLRKDDRAKKINKIL